MENTYKTIFSMYTADKLSTISEKKKAEIDAITILIFEAQEDVKQFQAIVDSLTEKYNNINAILVIDEGIRTQAYNNKVLMDQMVQSAKDLKNNSKIAIDEMTRASTKTKQLAPSVKDLVDKLIYAVELANKLSNLIIRKKALNPLISDELVSMIITTGKDANTAVSLLLVALQSTFTAQTSNLETEMILGLETIRANEFYDYLVKGDTGTNKSLLYYLNEAYAVAETKYKATEKACKVVIKQLNEAQAELNKAQVKLKSLQAGLAAVNAAAFAS